MAWTVDAASFDFRQHEADQARIKAMTTNLPAVGDREIVFLMSRLYFRESIEILTKLDTEAAHTALWQIALAGGNGSQTAAYTLIRRMTNKVEGAKLLTSKSPEVQGIALRGLLGTHGVSPVTLDRAAWELVKPTLTCSNLDTRSAAASVTGRDSGNEVSAEEKAQVFVASMRTTLKSPEAQKPITFWDYTWLYPCLLGEDVLAKQAIALGWMKGVTKEMLAPLTPAEPGPVREAVVIARFIAHDPTVRAELHQLLTNSPSGRLRMAALEQALNPRTVTEADRQCLEVVAASDPLEGKPGSDYARFTGDESLQGQRDRVIHPARILARRSLQALDTRKTQPASEP
jgi:hypothetical protein